MGQVAKFFKDFFIYGIGASAQLVVGLISLPIVTRIFDPTKYGVIDLSNSFIQIFATVFAFGIATATAFYFYQSSNHHDRTITVSSGSIFLLVINIILIIVGIKFASFFASAFFNDPDYAVVFKIALALAGTSIMYSHFMYLLRITRKPWRYIINSIFKIFLDLVSILFFLLILHTDIQGYFLALLVSSAVATTVAFLQNRQYIAFRFSKEQVSSLLKYGIPLLPAGIALWSLQLINRYFLAHYNTLAEVGLYGVAVRSTVLLLLLISSLKLAWIPFAFSIMKQENAKQVFMMIHKYLLIFAAGISLVTSLFAREAITFITTPEYTPAYMLTPILCFGLIFYALFNIVSIGIIINKKTILQSASVGAGALVNIGLNFLLIPKFGMYGAASSTAVSYLVAMATAQLLSRRYYYLRFGIKHIVAVLLLASSLTIIGMTLPSGLSLTITIPIKILLTLLFPLLLLVLNIIPSFERKQISMIIKQLPHSLPTLNK